MTHAYPGPDPTTDPPTPPAGTGAAGQSYRPQSAWAPVNSDGAQPPFPPPPPFAQQFVPSQPQQANRKARNPVAWILGIVGVIAVLGIGAFIVAHVTITTGGATTPAVSKPFMNPVTLGNDLTAKVDKRLSTPGTSYYKPGVTVTSAVCTADPTPLTFACALDFSDGQSGVATAVVASDGKSYVTKS
jgi:hypothetical protein